MTYVILPGRAAMIEYDGFHLNICNDNIWTLRTSILITELTPPWPSSSASLPPGYQVHSSYLYLSPAPVGEVNRGDYGDYEGTNQENNQYTPGPVEGLVTRSILLLVLVWFLLYAICY